MLHRAKLSIYKVGKIIRHFVVDIPASKTASLPGINRNTINRWYLVFRKAIYARQTQEFKKVIGEAEVDESYFGAKRVRGFRGKLKRGRGTRKQPIFGIFERNGRVYTERSSLIVRNPSSRPLFKAELIRQRRSIRTAGAAMTDW